MTSNNLISTAISADTKEAVFQKLAEIQALLQPVLLFNLSTEERMSMPKMGERTLAFVDKSLSYAADNTALLPSYLDLEEAQKDLALAADLSDIQRRTSTLLLSIEDSLMVTGAEAFAAARGFYGAVKGAHISNIPGTEGIEKDLAQHFPRKHAAKQSPPTV